VPGRATRLALAANLGTGRSKRRSTPRDMGRFAAGAIALSHTLGNVVTGGRSLTKTEARSVATIGFLSLALAGLVTVFPALVIAPLVIMLIWFGFALLLRALGLWRRIRRARRVVRRAKVMRSVEKTFPRTP